MCSYAATELSWQDFVPARFAACFETALSYVNKQHAVCIVIHIVHAYCNHLQRRCCQLSVNVFLSFKPLSLPLSLQTTQHSAWGLPLAQLIPVGQTF